MTAPEATQTGSDFLDAKLVEIRERIEELRPLKDEYTRLEAAEAALAGVPEEPPVRRRGGRRPAA